MEKNKEHECVLGRGLERIITATFFIPTEWRKALDDEDNCKRAGVNFNDKHPYESLIRALQVFGGVVGGLIGGSGFIAYGIKTGAPLEYFIPTIPLATNLASGLYEVGRAIKSRYF